MKIVFHKLSEYNTGIEIEGEGFYCGIDEKGSERFGEYGKTKQEALKNLEKSICEEKKAMMKEYNKYLDLVEKKKI